MNSIAELMVFAAVVEAGSFVKAADQLELTPSGISRKISRFEERLQVRLFNRTTRTLSLTEAGALLHERSLEILASIENAENTARDLTNSPTGKLRIAASDALSVQVIVPFLKKFSDLYPRLSILLIPSDGGIDMLNERIDVALMFHVPKETSFIASKLIDDPWLLCASPDYLALHGIPKHPNDLLNHRCLSIHAGGATNDYWVFNSNGSDQTIQVKSAVAGIGLTMKQAALEGLGVARLAHFLVCKEIMEGKLIPIMNEYIKWDNRALYAVYANREYLPSKSRVFLDEITLHIRDTLILPAKV